MKSVKMISIVLGGLLLLVIVLVIGGCGLLSWFMANFFCGNDLMQEVYSPNNEYRVVVFQRDCGATTGWSSQISVLSSSTSLRGQTGNVFFAPGHPDWFSFKVKWEDDSHIVIEHNGKPIPELAETEFRDFQIRYVENREGILPPRPFMPNELLLPVVYFPRGWTGEEWRPLGPEEIKGSHENSPYMLYTPPSAEYPTAGHYVDRFDNVDQAVEHFQFQRIGLSENYSKNCVPRSGSISEETIFTSVYSDRYFVGYAEEPYSDGSGEPTCQMIAQYDEFYVQFKAPISNDGLTYQQFNKLVRIIDQIMVQHLQQ